MGGIQGNTAACIANVQINILDFYRDVLWCRTHSGYLWKDKNIQRARRTAYCLQLCTYNLLYADREGDKIYLG